MIFFHADDYGINIFQSERMLDCCYEGVLNSVSVISNSPNLNECVDLLPTNIEVTLHLNFLEGKCTSKQEDVPLLVDQSGFFNLSFKKLLILSLVHPVRLKQEIYTESINQIEALLNCFSNNNIVIGIDSHRHYHMIPIVFSGVMNAVNQVKERIRYVRIADEAISPYWKNYKYYKRILTLSDVFKGLFLKMCSFINRKKLRKYALGLEERDVMGVMLSGKMTFENVTNAVKSFWEISNKKGHNLELIFHPGYLKSDEYHLADEFVDFYSDEMRKEEETALKKLKGYCIYEQSGKDYTSKKSF